MKTLFVNCATPATALMLMAAPAAAQEIRLTAALSGGEETPAPGVLTGAVGTALVTVDVARNQVIVELQILNLPNNSTAGHIHVGADGIAGPVVLDFAFPTGRTADFGLIFRLNRADFRARPEIGIRTIEDAIDAIVNGNAYVNVHTSLFPGGEIRGQIVRNP